MVIKKGMTIPLKIEKFALGGQGLAFVETEVAEKENGNENNASATLRRRVPIFVDDVCIGDEVEARLTKKKSSFGEGVLVRVTKESPERVPARCKHFSACGGCSWQFLAYERQLQWKEQLVRETLSHIGGFSEEVLGNVFGKIVGCDDPWYYRNKMEWSFSIDQVNGSLSGGFHVKKMHYDTVNVQECFLQSLRSVEIFKVIREFFVEMHARGENVLYDMRKHRGLLRSVFVREGKRTGEYMVIIQSSDTKFDTEAFLSRLETFPEIVSVVQIVVHDAKGFPTRLEERVLRGRDYYREEMHILDTQLQFHVKPLAFFQPNTLIAEKIYGEVVSLLRGHFSDDMLSKMRAYDLYCGTGTIGIVMSRYLESVIGIELNANAIASAHENAQLNAISNIAFHEGDVKNVLREMVGSPMDIMTIDPPRSGMETQVLEQVVAVAPKALVYVSCNPATFARDAKILCGNGYTLVSVRPFDQFPQTAHIETVALFTRE